MPSRHAWEIFQAMFGSKNAVRVEYLKKQLDKIKIQKGDNIVEHLTKIKDLQEELLNIDEVILEKDIISKTQNSLPPLYLTFQTSLTLSLHANLEPLCFEELVGLLLQEEKSRKNKYLHVDGIDQALVVHNKTKGKVSGHQSKSRSGQSLEK